jgi:hypothetical protein
MTDSINDSTNNSNVVQISESADDKPIAVIPKRNPKKESESLSARSPAASVLQALQYLHPVKKKIESDHDKASDEFSCRRADRRLNLSLLISPHHSHMRIVDYRMGQYKLKCSIFDQLASSRQLKKVFTLVEKQDSNSWRTVGFSKEAVIPGYFKNADGYLMSRVYDKSGKPITGGLAKLPHEKGVEFAEASPPSKKPNGLKIKLVEDPERLSEIITHNDAHFTYNPFGKGVYHPKFIMETKIGRKNLWVGGEVNEAFGHAKVDILNIPKSAKERKYLIWMLLQLCTELGEDHDVGSLFGFTMVDDSVLGQIFVDAGFKSTGQLTSHMKSTDGKPRDVYIWHRKFQNEASLAQAPFFNN